MRKSRIACIAAISVIVLVVIGLATTRNNRTDKIQTSDRVDTTAVNAGRSSNESETVSKVSPAETAIRAAAKQDRYAFVTFYRKDDDASSKMQAALKPVQGKLSGRADFVSVDVDDPDQQGAVARYGADQSPILLTLVIAPNGAVTAGFPKEIKKTDFSDVFVSNGLSSTLKVLQSQKLAAVCVQGAKTKNNKKSLATAEKLKVAPELGGTVEIVKVDPSDGSEAKFMKMCQVDTDSSDAQLLVLAPPGKLIGKFDSIANKGTILTSLQSALGGSGCGTSGGCGPSGCGP